MLAVQLWTHISVTHRINYGTSITLLVFCTFSKLPLIYGKLRVIYRNL